MSRVAMLMIMTLALAAQVRDIASLQRRPAPRTARILARLVVAFVLWTAFGATAAISPTHAAVRSGATVYRYDASPASTTPPVNTRIDAATGDRPGLGTQRPSPSLISSRHATKAGEEGLDGASRTYIDITKGSSVRNVGTDATADEFADTLTKRGFDSRASKDGSVQIFSKDGAKYVLRQKNSSGFAGSTADYTPAGAKGHTLEIRMGYKP